MEERIIEATDVGTDEQLMLSVAADERLYVGEEHVWSISALGGGIVALATQTRTAHIDGADYWRLLHGDSPPSRREAGYLEALLAHVREHASELLELLDEEELLDNAYYPSIAEVATALQTALGVELAERPVSRSARLRR